MNTRSLIILGVAGGLGYYLWTKNRQANTAQLIAQKAGAVTSSPSLLDALLGKATGAAAAFLQQASALDAKIRARGTAHYTAWKKAVDRKEKSYAVGDACFVTATGTQTAMAVCFDEGVPGVLRGY